MIDLLKKLISIKSWSGEESEIVDFVHQLLIPIPGNLERIDNIVIWKNEWKEDRQTIALGAHLDTVPYCETDWIISPPTIPIEKDGKIYGRGACDMKAGAAIILDIIRNQDIGDQYNIMAFWYDREELGIPNGVTTMMNHDMFNQVDLCIIPEPTSCVINYGVFGNLDAKIIGHGISVHSSKPKLGRNAIYELIPVLERIKDFPVQTIAGIEEAMSVNIIEGGKAINVVPAYAALKMDYRFDPRKSESEIITFIKSFESTNVTTEIIGCFPGVIHDTTKNILLQNIIKLVGKSEVVPFWSDIGQLGTKDIVAINFGPGSINQAHTIDEYVPIEEVHFVRNSIVAFLKSENI